MERDLWIIRLRRATALVLALATLVAAITELLRLLL